MAESTQALWMADGEQERPVQWFPLSEMWTDKSSPKERCNTTAGASRKNVYLLGVFVAVVVICTTLGLTAVFLRKGHLSQPNHGYQENGGIVDSAETGELSDIEVPVQLGATGKPDVAAATAVSRGTSSLTRPATPRRPTKLTTRKARLLKVAQGGGEAEPASCTTEHCRNQSDYLKQTIKFTADPCNDFYDYVCGNYRVYQNGPYAEIEQRIHSATIPALNAETVPDLNQNAFQKAAALYQACIAFITSNGTELEQLKLLMVNLSLDLLKLSASGAVDPIYMVARLSFEVGVPVLFEFKLFDDHFVEGKRAMQFKIADSQQAWERKRDKAVQKEATGVLAYISDQLVFYPDYDPEKQEHKELAKTISNYEQAFFTSLKTTEKGTDLFIIRRIDIISKHTEPQITAAQWIGAVRNYTNGTYVGLDAIQFQKQVLVALAGLLKSASWGPNGFRAMLAWGLFDYLLDYALPKNALFGEVEEVACYRHVLNVMEYAATSRYLHSAVTENALKRAADTFEGAREVIRTQLIHGSNIQDTLKSALLRILFFMNVHICSPEGRLDEIFVNEHFADFPDMSASGPFLDAFFKALSGRARQKWKDQTHILFNTSRATPYYSKINNSVVIPAGALLPISLFADGHPALTVGSLGDALAHEIMKAFDVKGPDQCYTAATIKKYDTAVKCLETSQKKAKLPLPTSRSRFVGLENVADLVGISMAHKMFWALPSDQRSWTLPDVNLTGEQLAFVGRCMTKCKFDANTPTENLAGPRARCNVPAMNYPLFLVAFGCSRSARMREERACTFGF